MGRLLPQRHCVTGKGVAFNPLPTCSGVAKTTAQASVMPSRRSVVCTALWIGAFAAVAAAQSTDGAPFPPCHPQRRTAPFTVVLLLAPSGVVSPFPPEPFLHVFPGRKSSTVPTPLQELLALEQLYDRTNGDHWFTNLNWEKRDVTFYTDPCLNSWYGVICDDDGLIVGVNLSDNNLTGTVPPDIGNMTSLRHLDLHDNVLHGELPDTLGELHLDYLRVGSNNLQGAIPASLGLQVNMTYLRLSSNNFSGPIPPELANVTALTFCYLENNALSGAIPAELGNVQPLQRLLLSNNSLSGAIPDALQDLQRLEFLLMNDNQLSGLLPVHLGNMVSLKHLYAYNNNLTGDIPEHVAQIPDLQRFYVFGNPHLNRRYAPELFNLGTVLAVEQYETHNARRRPVTHNDFGFH